MKRAETIAVCFAGGLALAGSLRANEVVLPGNPYAVVVTRNIFGLNPPPVVDPNAVVVEPPVKIIPNGIMTILGQLQVLFKVAAKPGSKDKDANYILTEGQSQDDIEVVKINEKAGSVTFNNHGIVQELPLIVASPTSTPSEPTVGNPAKPVIRPSGGPQGAPAGNNPFINRFGSRERIPGGGEKHVEGGGTGGAALRSIPTRGGTTAQ
jgi:hypothetical protein